MKYKPKNYICNNCGKEQYTNNQCYGCESTSFSNIIPNTKEHDEGEELFKKFCEEVEQLSNGLIETNKAEFIKQYAFYMTVTYPTIRQFAEAITGVKVK